MNRTQKSSSRREEQDKSLLKSVAQDLQTKLSRRLKGFHSSGKVAVLDEPGVDGWYVKLGTIKGTDLLLTTALDGYTSRGPKRFWFGFAASKPEPLKRMEDNCPAHWRPLKSPITGYQVWRGRPGKWRLGRTLGNKSLGRPIFEAYRECDPQEFYWGIYDETSENVVRTALSFFAEMRKLLFRIESKDRNV